MAEAKKGKENKIWGYIINGCLVFVALLMFYRYLNGMTPF